MKLNELYKKDSLDKNIFDSGDIVVDKTTGTIGTVLSKEPSGMFMVKWRDSVTSPRNPEQIRLASKDELKAK